MRLLDHVDQIERFANDDDDDGDHDDDDDNDDDGLRLCVGIFIMQLYHSV